MTHPWAEGSFRLALRLLPAALRERAGEEMLDILRTRLDEATGAGARFAVWLDEVGGVCLTALHARRPDAWARRTEPVKAPRAYADVPDPTLPLSRRLLVDQIVADIRFALRTFVRRPMMLGIAVASLALGIGASSAMFSVVNTVLLRPLPFEEPDRLVSIYPSWPELRNHPTMAEMADRGTFAWPEVWDIADNQTVFESIGAYDYGSAIVAGDGPPERLELAIVTPQLFNVIRVTPVAGSLFSPDASGQKEILLSHALWQQRFGGRANVVGTSLTLNGDPYLIVGVMPAHAGVGTREPDVWLPRFRQPGDAGARGNHSGLRMIGRLKSGITVEQARDQMTRVMQAVTPPDHGKHGASVFQLQADRTRQVRPALLLLLAASGLLLAVGCANVAAILLGAGLARGREIAVRSALGAARARIVRQLLTESMVLALVGGAGGVAVAGLAMRGLLLIAPPNVPRIGEAALDGGAVAFAVLVSILSGVVFGVLPAVTLSRQRPAAALTSSRGSTGARGWAQPAVVVGELALATVLLVGGALLTRTLVALNHVEPGFRADELLTVRLSLPWYRFRNVARDSIDRVVDGYFQRFVDEVAALPGVRAVTVTSNVPLTDDRGNNDVEPEGWQPRGDEKLLAERRFVSANYFETMGIAMRAGRGFTRDDDRLDAPKTMVISEGLAHRVWASESAIGKHVTFWGGNKALVVGVAADVRDESLDAPTRFAFYIPARQYGSQTGSMVVRTTGDPTALIQSIRARVRAVDPGVAVSSIESFRALIANEVSAERYRARLMLVFAVLAALFAAMGVYGVTARSVALRTREIGIRVALGAEPRAVLTEVLLQGLRLAAIGALLGLAIAVASRHALDGLLYGVTASDPMSLGIIAALVCVVAALAALPPGRRATGVNPLEALRSE